MSALDTAGSNATPPMGRWARRGRTIVLDVGTHDPTVHPEFEQEAGPSAAWRAKTMASWKVPLRDMDPVSRIVANLPVNKKGLAQALKWVHRLLYNNPRTLLWVTYGPNDTFYGALIKNDRDTAARWHAENVFARERLPKLKEHIKAELAAGRIRAAPDGRVVVRLTLNRLPCPHCAALIAELNADPLIRFKVTAASASRNATDRGAAEAHIAQSIVPMLSKGVEVGVVRTYEVLRSKLVDILQAVQQKRLPELTPSEIASWQAARKEIDTALSEAAALRWKIESAKKRVAKGVRPR